MVSQSGEARAGVQWVVVEEESQVMTKSVYTVPLYADAHIAARVTRNHKIHHMAVAHEQQPVGILSALDLLRLVEDHRFVLKNPPTSSRNKESKRV
jgi:signal-transduction protein with cAMP-binding, CBS, and nucleotidyltransferase domain